MGRSQAQGLTHRDALCWQGDGLTNKAVGKAAMSGMREGGAGGFGEDGMCTVLGHHSMWDNHVSLFKTYTNLKAMEGINHG